ncbi:putative prefoldin subunit 5 [Cryptosporidium serpentis]
MSEPVTDKAEKGFTKESIPLSSLPPAKLLQLREQVQQETSDLNLRLQHLNIALNRFKNSRESLESLKPKNKDCEILAPISQSVYIDAKLANVEEVLVDIGTGYHVEMPISKAKTHFDKKIELVKKSLDTCAKSLTDKNKIFDAINEILLDCIKANKEIAK